MKTSTSRQRLGHLLQRAMPRLSGLRIASQLGIMAAVVVAAMLVLVVGGRHGMQVATDALSTVYQHHAAPMGSYGTALDQLHRARMRIVLAMESQYVKQANEHFEHSVRLEQQAAQSLEATFAKLGSDDERRHAEQFKAAMVEYAKVREQVVKLYGEGDRSAAVSEFRANLAPHFNVASEALGALLQAQVAGAAAAYEQAAGQTARVQVVNLVVAAIGLLIVGGLCWWLARSISAPIRGVVESAHAIANGDLSQPLSVDAGGEAGDLQRALAGMQDALRAMVRQIHDASQTITTASVEIANGNLDLSTRTEQTASNLQQTAASMEQLAGSVKQSSDAASQANQLAASARDVATRGGEAVTRVVTTMDAINAASKKIADIIGVIDGIAFQTNILALNAAVEAARAGDQGRGFAVVAGEVRSLAQRSAQAAKEIKSLIGASVQQVDSGSRLVRDAGATMDEIVGSVCQVSTMIAEISAAASEQNGGIAQVGQAVGTLDSMTQQNAALVEESAAAAESLKSQAYRLGELVQRFKLEGKAVAA